MSQWYSLNGDVIYYSNKVFQETKAHQIWMTVCGNDQNKVLVGYESDNEVITEENRMMNMDLSTCILGNVDLAMHSFTIKYNGELHTFQLRNESQTDCWYTQLSSMVGNAIIRNHQPVTGKARERTTSVGTAKVKQKALLYRKFSPCALKRENTTMEPYAREYHIRSATSDGIFSNYASTSLDVSDEVFNSSVPRTSLKYYSEKSLNNFGDGCMRDNDIMCLFDAVRDKANEHLNNIKMELLVTQIDLLENILHQLLSDDDTEYVKTRYGKKIRSILESLREHNPYLPTFNKLPNINHFVDNYGFKHNLGDSGGLKLVCQKMLNDLKLRLQTLDTHVKQINESLHNHRGDAEMNLESIEAFSPVGFPSILRIPIWNVIVNHHLKKIKFPVKQTKNYFALLLQQVNTIDVQVKQMIKVDSYKIYNQNIHFDPIDSVKIRDIQNIMMALHVRNNIFTYSPLLMKISALGILIFEAVEVFRLMVAISESIIGSKVINQCVSTSLADEMFLKKLLCDNLPELNRHFLETNTDVSFLTKRWIDNLFTDCFPFESSLRIFDMFLIKGQEWIVLLSAVIIKLEWKKIKVLEKAGHIYKHLNNRYNQLFDIDYILEETKRFEMSFPSGYIARTRKQFQDKYVQQNKSNMNVRGRSNQIRFQDNCTAFQHIAGKIECTCFNDEHIFISVARQSNSEIYLLNFICGFLKEKSLKMNMFVSVMKCTKSFLVVASDLGVVAAFDLKERDWIWKVTLQNCPLDMAFVDVGTTVQLFISLDNGALTIKEDFFSKSTDSIFHLQVSLSSIYKMVYSSPYLICVSGQNILIIDPSTITIINKITLSSDQHMVIQDIKVDKTFVWLAFKGSTILQLWNIETCAQIFTQNVAISQGRRILSGSITLLYPIVGQHQLWIATDTGEMFIYDVKCCMSREWPLHNSDLQLNHHNNSWECHQAVVDKVTDYLSSISHRDIQRLSVAVIEDDFVDISIMMERECSRSCGSLEENPIHEEISQFTNPTNFISHSPIPRSNLSHEEIHLKQKTFLSLKGGMKISDSPILHVCSLVIPNEIEEAFMTISSYMEEEDNIVVWKQGAQGWKYKVMHYDSLEQSKNFFLRLIQKMQLPLM